MNWVSLLMLVASHISEIERIGTELAGPDKKAAVLDAVKTALTIATDATGKNLTPSDETMKAVSDAIDVIVEVMNLAKNPANIVVH